MNSQMKKNAKKEGKKSFGNIVQAILSIDSWTDSNWIHLFYLLHVDKGMWLEFVTETRFHYGAN